MKEKIVIALGGNALGNDPESQKEAVRNTAQNIVDLIAEGYQLVITHGNGPQVGMINLAMDIASKNNTDIPEMPFAECGAMSQGYIGFHLQNALQNELRARGFSIPVVTLVTQVLVDQNDPAFQNPTKPVGAFYSSEEAERMRTKGFVMKEDAGRGYRRVVPSPEPREILELESIKLLLAAGHVVIAIGGGGIPVVEEDREISGISAVIDKDLSSAKLAEQVDADTLIILTAVEKVAINYGKPEEKWLDQLSIEEAEKYIEAGEFAEGSMLPKIKAGLAFTSSRPGRKTLITSLDKAIDGLKGKTGTWILS
ncbi:MAG TPA: carbamate kinase [Halanaerobiaceae bacterium]|jgi:carbamate kinase|nr:carbamate kinase [Bacillota bacterium]HHU92345.1 carbamate kinase [Halanaerobiaceae bacterium]HOA39864.1 carbamate kinase [Halanaerobiales bacterium]HPZ61939.1 carbamate kinase [Halanaerobiales bacterium]HQD03338.1 carbamate kinase [Halanaerobiales bacterium]